MIEKMERSKGKVFGVSADGEISLEQFEQLLPEIEELIRQHGKINLLFLIKSMKGYGLKEFVADIKFAVKHWNDVEKVAIVSEKHWWAAAAKIDNLFTKWEERFFDASELEQAWEWVEL